MASPKRPYDAFICDVCLIVRRLCLSFHSLRRGSERVGGRRASAAFLRVLAAIAQRFARGRNRDRKGARRTPTSNSGSASSSKIPIGDRRCADYLGWGRDCGPSYPRRRVSGRPASLEEVLSPISNQRTDAYGGTRENRMRFPLQAQSFVPPQYERGRKPKRPSS